MREIKLVRTCYEGKSWLDIMECEGDFEYATLGLANFNKNEILKLIEDFNEECLKQEKEYNELFNKVKDKDLYQMFDEYYSLSNSNSGSLFDFFCNKNYRRIELYEQFKKMAQRRDELKQKATDGVLKIKAFNFILGKEKDEYNLIKSKAPKDMISSKEKGDLLERWELSVIDNQKQEEIEKQYEIEEEKRQEEFLKQYLPASHIAIETIDAETHHIKSVQKILQKFFKLGFTPLQVNTSYGVQILEFPSSYREEDLPKIKELLLEVFGYEKKYIKEW